MNKEDDNVPGSKVCATFRAGSLEGLCCIVKGGATAHNALPFHILHNAGLAQQRGTTPKNTVAHGVVALKVLEGVVGTLSPVPPHLRKHRSSRALSHP